MSIPQLTSQQVVALHVLASGILPADARGSGVAPFNPGVHLAAKLQGSPFAASLEQGLAFALGKSREMFSAEICDLPPNSVATLLAVLREGSPAFFKFLRIESCALYLSQPDSWRRIGFPGPSIEQGGYPDFDRPQS